MSGSESNIFFEILCISIGSVGHRQTLLRLAILPDGLMLLPALRGHLDGGAAVRDGKLQSHRSGCRAKGRDSARRAVLRSPEKHTRSSIRLVFNSCYCRLYEILSQVAI